VTYKSDGWRIIQKSKKKNAKSQFKIAADWASDSFGVPSQGGDVGFPLLAGEGSREREIRTATLRAEPQCRGKGCPYA
jgi:hypothetical protein